MSIRSTLASFGAAALISLNLAGAVVAAEPHDSCFLASEWAGWRSPSPTVIYLRVNANQIYEVDLASGSSMLQDPGMHLVSHVEGSDWICAPVDLRLEVADDHGGIREPLFVKSIRRLTPEEVKAIPRRDLP